MTKFEELVIHLKHNWPTIIVLIVLLAPTLWLVAEKLVFGSRIDSLQEQINLLERRVEHYSFEIENYVLQISELREEVAGLNDLNNAALRRVEIEFKVDELFHESNNVAVTE